MEDGKVLTDKDGGCPTTTRDNMGCPACIKGPGQLAVKDGKCIKCGEEVPKTQGGHRVVPRSEWVPEAIEQGRKRREKENEVFCEIDRRMRMRKLLEALRAVQHLEDQTGEERRGYYAGIVRRALLEE